MARPKPVIDSLARRSRPTRKGEKTERDLSIQGQHAVNLRRIEEYGGGLGEQFTEPGKSAWRPGVERPKFNEVVARLKSGASQGICIYDIDRMLRRVTDAVKIVEIAEMGFIVLDADGEYDLMTPNGREQFYNKAVAAESFSFKLSKKLRRGFETKALLGEGNPGRYRPVGFEDDATTVRESEREPLRRAARAALDKGNWVAACTVLNKAGILTADGNQWVSQSARRALIAPRMAGHIMRGGVIAGRLPGEPILDEITWQELDRLAHSRKPGREAMGTYLLSHTRVRCGNCGHWITGFTPQPQQSKYICKKRKSPAGKKTGCGVTVAGRAPLDEVIKELTIARLSDPGHKIRVAEAAAQRRENARPHEKELMRLIDLRNYWDRQLVDGDCDQVRHHQMTSTINEKIKKEEQKLAEIGVTEMRVPAEESADKAREAWEAGDSDQRKRMIEDAFSGFHVFVSPAPITNKNFEGRISVTPIVDEDR